MAEKKTVKKPVTKVRYEVVHHFEDLQDNSKAYQVGDTFPKPANKKVSQERLAELSGKDNKQGKVLIKKIEE
ncbi:hypothetical protein JTF04_11455 [Mammaliicoccus vitulinus]|uniref:hypothetical protein n=1 Tax=Mammaliicoccus vitulinus TaxID=71237 RepID=UPI00194E38E7|nr:hypothetical protein [Mammaliicoccus vitulinus]MBM6630302.1 hypothetical protein [Mammaliicoccus vitulinus]